MEDDYKNDIEEQELTEEDSAVSFLNKKQRELITSTIDYNLESISQLILKKVIDLVPKYQRRFRWDDVRKSKLIESFFMSVPIPPIFLNEDDLGKYSVIDGKQRLSAIHDFLSGTFKLTGLKVFSDLNGFKFFDLPIEFQNTLNTRASVRAIIILRQSNKDIKYEVFQRLNTGGVRLNAQEIRNSAFPGPLNDKIMELSSSKIFHKMLGVKNKDKSRIYQEMRDAELVLRFFSLKDNWENYAGGLKRIFDSFMDKNKNLNKNEIKKLEEDFYDTLSNVEILFGDDGSFRRWLPNLKWKQQISAPLFDAQMFSCYKKDKVELKKNRTKILTDFKKLFTNDFEFIESIESSTGAPTRFIYRIQKLEEIIDKYI